MNEWERASRMAKIYKERYPRGTRIELIQMGDDPHPIAPGTKGTVVYVDDMGQIGVKWDNGRTLSLIPEEDDFGSFTTFVNVGGESKNNYEILVEMNCKLGKPTELVDNYIITCDIANNDYSIKESFYLYPFYYINDYYDPLEVIIPNKIKNKASFLFPKFGLYIFFYLILLI